MLQGWTNLSSATKKTSTGWYVIVYFYWRSDPEVKMQQERLGLLTTPSIVRMFMFYSHGCHDALAKTRHARLSPACGRHRHKQLSRCWRCEKYDLPIIIIITNLKAQSGLLMISTKKRLHFLIDILT